MIYTATGCWFLIRRGLFTETRAVEECRYVCPNISTVSIKIHFENQSDKVLRTMCQLKCEKSYKNRIIIYELTFRVIFTS